MAIVILLLCYQQELCSLIILSHSPPSTFIELSSSFSGKACGNFAHVLIIIQVINRNVNALHSSCANDHGNEKLQGWDHLVYLSIFFFFSILQKKPRLSRPPSNLLTIQSRSGKRVQRPFNVNILLKYVYYISVVDTEKHAYRTSKLGAFTKWEHLSGRHPAQETESGP